MVLNQEAVMEVIEVLAENENLKATFRATTKAAVITGIGALIGGLLGGKVGLAIGGTVSTVYAACTNEDCKPVIYILKNDLTLAQIRKLTDSVRILLRDINVLDIGSLILFVMSNQNYKQRIINQLAEFLLTEMKMSLI